MFKRLFSKMFKKRLLSREDSLIGLRKKSLKFFYLQAMKEYRISLDAYNDERIEEFVSHQNKHALLVNRFMKESAELKKIYSLKG